MDNTTKASLFSDTIKFRHSYLTQTSLTPTNHITHALSILACTLQDLPTITFNAQLETIACIKALFGKWKSTAVDPLQIPPLVPTNEFRTHHSDLPPTEVPTPYTAPRVVPTMAPTPYPDPRLIPTAAPRVPPAATPRVTPTAAPRVPPPLTH